MGKITYIEHDNTEHEVELVVGSTLMDTAVNNAVPGIDGDCGGACACGTCHLIVSDEWLGRLGEPGSDELQLLDMTPERCKTSRLGCQVEVTEAMDGLIVRLPEFQM
ncbi:2Fe-2S iron-sulfur cluster-binding protein [Abyssibacter profundi]|uniref:2Fe-2S ferredoxin n=1 Tax=Abyssibacter profundi TaxID=2182787 RepID=A0A383XRP0_9GAMM|nr:2Fe-2S iron-sulfur cluster-binding protein [Abyssibacter profundi]MBR9814691.1 2Fe-2S iron-sulfur cluster binding domain-containing protein [bacterium]MBV61407.1 2Fe-2S ferredoxin [Nevskiales bacterium]MEC9406030.1 2Fe-2S iron-sulfur cluster-binding protein [Pseudomonadota bacterium]PWN55294.1 2Fe-2S ferredoxin [Abyssibacter profundi]